MNQFQITKKLRYLLFFMLFVLSCDKGDNNFEKTSDFIPAVNNYEFFIEGQIENKLLHYQQINIEGTNISNRYFIDAQETWLQAYNDKIDRKGAWRIRIHNVDIETIETPYILKQSEGSISWYDSRIDLIIKDTEYCQGVDSGCTFILKSEMNNIIITNVSNRIIEGTFDGKAILVRTGFIPGHDESLYYEIENGKFLINYRIK